MLLPLLLLLPVQHYPASELCILRCVRADRVRSSFSRRHRRKELSQFAIVVRGSIPQSYDVKHTQRHIQQRDIEREREREMATDKS